MADSEEILSRIADFGLTKIEAGLYVLLQNRPPQTILQLSRLLEVPRTTIYDCVQKLSEMGLVERLIKYKTQQIQAAPLSSLDLLISKEKARLERLSGNLDFIKANLSIKNITGTQTQIKYYYGREGLRQIMWNALSAEKETIGYSEFGRAEVLGDKFVKDWITEFRARGLRDRVVINDSEKILSHIKTNVLPGKHQMTLDDIRIIGADQFYVSGDTTIYNNIFAVCYWRQGELVGVEIENPELVKAQKSIFEILWSKALPIK